MPKAKTIRMDKIILRDSDTGDSLVFRFTGRFARLRYILGAICLRILLRLAKKQSLEETGRIGEETIDVKWPRKI